MAWAAMRRISVWAVGLPLRDAGVRDGPTTRRRSSRTSGTPPRPTPCCATSRRSPGRATGRAATTSSSSTRGEATPCARAWKRSGTGRGSACAPGTSTSSRRARQRPRTGRAGAADLRYRLPPHVPLLVLRRLRARGRAAAIIFDAPGHGLGAPVPPGLARPVRAHGSAARRVRIRRRQDGPPDGRKEPDGLRRRSRAARAADPGRLLPLPAACSYELPGAHGHEHVEIMNVSWFAADRAPWRSRAPSTRRAGRAVSAGPAGATRRSGG